MSPTGSVRHDKNILVPMADERRKIPLRYNSDIASESRIRSDGITRKVAAPR
jgi:hypothetical protein